MDYGKQISIADGCAKKKWQSQERYPMPVSRYDGLQAVRMERSLWLMSASRHRNQSVFLILEPIKNHFSYAACQPSIARLFEGSLEAC
jgi:hypothetical protein